MRRYPQLHSTPNAVAAFPSEGSAPPSVIQTSNRRRYPQFGGTLALVATLPSVGVAIADSKTVTFDGGGIISRASLKRLKRQAEEQRRRRESTWDAGLLASKELVEQVTRAMDGAPSAAPQQAKAKFIDDEEEEIEMLLMAA